MREIRRRKAAIDDAYASDRRRPLRRRRCSKRPNAHGSGRIKQCFSNIYAYLLKRARPCLFGQLVSGPALPTSLPQPNNNNNNMPTHSVAFCARSGRFECIAPGHEFKWGPINDVRVCVYRELERHVMRSPSRVLNTGCAKRNSVFPSPPLPVPSKLPDDRGIFSESPLAANLANR